MFTITTNEETGKKIEAFPLYYKASAIIKALLVLIALLPLAEKMEKKLIHLIFFS